MKTKSDIEKALKGVGTLKYQNYSALTYSDGLRDALEWVIDKLPDKEFAPLEKQIAVMNFEV